jgi:hypothetical protein
VVPAFTKKQHQKEERNFPRGAKVYGGKKGRRVNKTITKNEKLTVSLHERFLVGVASLALVAFADLRVGHGRGVVAELVRGGRVAVSAADVGRGAAPGADAEVQRLRGHGPVPERRRLHHQFNHFSALESCVCVCKVTCTDCSPW